MTKAGNTGWNSGTFIGQTGTLTLFTPIAIQGLLILLISRIQALTQRRCWRSKGWSSRHRRCLAGCQSLSRVTRRRVRPNHRYSGSRSMFWLPRGLRIHLVQVPSKWARSVILIPAHGAMSSIGWCSSRLQTVIFVPRCLNLFFITAFGEALHG